MATIVQGPISASSTSAPSSLGVTFPSNVTAGNHVIVVVRQANVLTVTAQARTVTVSETLSSGYTQHVASDASPSDSDVRIFSAKLGSGGANTVTAAFSGGGSTGRAEIVVWEVSGLDATTWLEATNKATGSSTSPSAGSVTMAGGGFAVAAMHTVNGYRTAGGGSGWTATDGAAIWAEAHYETRLPSSGGTYTGNFTLSPSDSWTAIVAAFKDAAPSAPVLSSPTITNVTATGATVGCTTDTTSGTLYVVATSSTTKPTAAQVKNGQDHTGATADDSGSTGVSTTTPSVALNALTSGVTRYIHYVHNANSADSTVLTSNAIYPGTFRPVSDVAVSGWTLTGASTHAEALSEDAAGDSSYTTSPALSGTPSTLDLRLVSATNNGGAAPASGSYSFQFRARKATGTCAVVLKFYDASNNLVGTSTTATVNNAAFTTYTVTVTLTGTAVRAVLEATA